MSRRVRALAFIALLEMANPMGASAAPPAIAAPSVVRTSHGIAHIEAEDYAALGYGFGFVYATDNLCLLADQIVTSRGLRTFYLGADGEAAGNIASDAYVRAQLPDHALIRTFAKTSQEGRDLIDGFVAGYNRYLATTSADRRDPTCGHARWLMPARATDIYRLIAMKVETGTQFSSAIVDAVPVPAGQPAGSTAFALGIEPGQASNGWAFGKAATDNGRGLLFANPHFPWSGANRFYQVHLSIPGKLDVMGATIAPIPMVAIGFNRDVAWTHTVSPGSRFTFFELTLDPRNPERYRVDGRYRRVRRISVSVPISDRDGVVRQERHVVAQTIYGPIISSRPLGIVWGRERAYALADVNRGNLGQVDTWLGFAGAKSVEDIRRQSARTVSMPWLTTTAADRNGRALFGDFSRVPNISVNQLDACKASAVGQAIARASGYAVLDGSRAACDWINTGAASNYVSGEALPTIFRDDYVANSNDSYWFVNQSVRLPRSAPLMGRYAVEQGFRTRMGIAEIEARLRPAGQVPLPMTRAAIEQILFSNRNYAAENFLTTILSTCGSGSSVDSADQAIVSDACHVLEAWDRRDGLQSRGAVLFREFWSRVAAIPGLFKTPFADDDPGNTPRDINAGDAVVAERLRQALAGAGRALAANGISLGHPLGDVQAVVRDGRRIPIPGGASNAGVLNTVATTPLGRDGYTPTYGTSYIQIVGFDDDGPVADGLLAYSQSTDQRSPYFADQTDMFSRGELYRLPFSKTDISGDPQTWRLDIADDPAFFRQRSRAAETARSRVPK